VIVIDANLLIYAYNSSAEQYERSRTWFTNVLSGDIPVRLAWSTIHAFLRLTTHPTLFPQPLTVDDAVMIIENWLAHPIVDILEAGPAYWTVLRTLLHDARIHGPRVMDAHLAALAIEHGLVVCSADTDFARFSEIRWLNPVAS